MFMFKLMTKGSYELNSSICIGVADTQVNADGSYSFTIPRNGDYFIIARANASTGSTQPLISLQIGDSIVRRNLGAVGGNVVCFYSAQLFSGNIVTVNFENIVPNYSYNSFFILKMHNN